MTGEKMKKCETCKYYDTDKDDMPCCTCCDGVNYEADEELKGSDNNG